jgi:hypothetical protein
MRKPYTRQAMLSFANKWHTYRLEGGNLVVAVGVKVLLRVVYSHATIDTVR